MVTFTNIPSGTYLVIVASISADFSDMKFAEASVDCPVTDANASGTPVCTRFGSS